MIPFDPIFTIIAVVLALVVLVAGGLMIAKAHDSSGAGCLILDILVLGILTMGITASIVFGRTHPVSLPVIQQGALVPATAAPSVTEATPQKGSSGLFCLFGLLLAWLIIAAPGMKKRKIL